MKKILLVLLVIACCAGCVWSQGSAPTAPSPVVRSGNVVKNALTSSNTQNWYLIVRHNGYYDTLILSGITVGDQAVLYATGWRFGESGREINRIYADTLTITSGGYVHIGNDYIAELVGSGLVNNAGTLQAILGSTVSTGEIDDQTITKNDIDSTSSPITLSALYLGNGGDSTNIVMTKRYSDSAMNGLPFSTWNGGRAHGKIPKIDSTGGYHLTWADDAGATSGDDIKFDSADVILNPSTTNIKAGTGIIFSRGSDGDSIIITSTNGAAIRDTLGDTIKSAGAQYNWSGANMDSMRLADADTVRADLYLMVGNEASPNQPLTLNSTDISCVQNITGDRVGTSYGTDLTITASSIGTGIADMIFSCPDSIEFWTGVPPYIYMKYDSLVGNGNVTKGWKWMAGDSIKIGDSIYTNTDRITGLVSKGALEDSLDNYVLQSNENLRDSGSYDWILYGEGSTKPLHVKQQIVTGDDTISLYSESGSADVMRIKGKSVRLEGGTGPTQFNSTVNHTGQSVDSVKALDADTLRADALLRLNNTAETYYVGLKAPTGLTATTVFTVPSADYTGSDAYGLLATNKSGALSFIGSSSVVSGTGGGGNALYAIDSSAAHLLDSTIFVEGSGASLRMSKKTGLDSLFISVDSLQPSNFRTQDSIATNKEIAESLAIVHRQKFVATSVYGTDSMWFNSGTNSVRLLNITAKHTGGDTTFIRPNAGGGLVVGRDTGNTYLDQDSVIVKTGMYFGYAGKSRVDSAFIDSIRANEFGPGAGVAGDITAVGSMTSGDAFAGGGADQDWLGLGAAAGRIQFKAQGVGTTNDAVLIPTGTFVVGRDTAISYKFEVVDSGVDVGSAFTNPDTTTSGSDASLHLRTMSKTDGTLGGDPALMLDIVNGETWSIGVDNSAADRLKVSWGDEVGTNAKMIFDTTGWVTIGDSVYRASFTAESLLATVNFVKKRLPWYQNATDIAWNYPTADADTSMHCTYPYVSVYDTTYLAKVSTSTGADTVFGLVVPFYIQDSVTIDSFIIYALTSSATADSSKIDSVHFTWEGADSTAVVALTSNTTDRVGTSLTRYAMALSRSATPGEIVRARVVCALKQDESYVTIRKAQIKGTKRS